LLQNALMPSVRAFRSSQIMLARSNLEIHTPRGKAPTIIFTDNGIGLTEEEVHRFLATIAKVPKSPRKSASDPTLLASSASPSCRSNKLACTIGNSRFDGFQSVRAIRLARHSNARPPLPTVRSPQSRPTDETRQNAMPNWPIKSDRWPISLGFLELSPMVARKRWTSSSVKPIPLSVKMMGRGFAARCVNLEVDLANMIWLDLKARTRWHQRRFAAIHG